MSIEPEDLGRIARSWGLDRAWPLIALGLLALAALALALGPSLVPGQDDRTIEDVALPHEASQRGLNVQDTDADGLSNSLENYVYATDPEDPDTRGDGLPDGYLGFFGYDPLETNASQRTVADPPASALPAGFDGDWPDRYDLPLADFYERTRPQGYTLGEDAPWWKKPQVPSPEDWDVNGDGIADAWLVAAGLNPFETDLTQVAPGSNDTLTVRENWQLGTNPSRVDTDRDGIPDAEEADLGTDPLAFSTLGADVADGWLQAKGLDPLDPAPLFADPDQDGLATAEEFQESRAWMPNASVDRIAAQGLDPFDWDTSGNGIPDGWLVANDVDPMDPDVADRVTERASAFAPLRHVEEGPGELEPLGDLELTVRDEYEAGQPPGWNETVDGVWWGGTSPATNDTDDDGLPDAVEVRGWYVELTLDKGPGAQPAWALVHSNPSSADTDSDGLADLEEYRGRAQCGDDGQRSFPPTHPSRRDSAFSGLTDRQTVCGFTLGATSYDLGSPAEGGLDPTAVDSDGDLLADGSEARYWHQRARTVRDPYPFPDARFDTTVEIGSSFPSLAGASPGKLAERLAPDGDWDGDGRANVLDPDSSSALSLKGESVCTQSSTDPGTVFLLDGPQVDASLYQFTDLGSQHARPGTDPANPDTDGDGLPDAWEIRNARFLTAQGRWSLDPSSPSSPGGTAEGKLNLDDDHVRFFAPPDRTRTYDHNNLQECRSGTDPNVLSSDEDGVSDGWKVFWGLRYTTLVQSGDPLVGELTDAQTSRILQRASSVSIAPGQPLSGTPAWLSASTPVSYARYTTLAEGTSSICDQRAAQVETARSNTSLAAWERIPSGASEDAPCVRTADDETRLLLPIRGSYNATLAQLAGTGANPYLVDADADDLPDWWEGLVHTTAGEAATRAPSPLGPDADADEDGDTLTTLEEFDAWSSALATDASNGGPNPALADSDRDGLSDAEEVQVGFDAKDPRTIQRLRSQGGDADGDGVSDLQEIKGWDYEGKARRFKTNPVGPDSDADGLLDRLGQSGRDETLDALGVAHRSDDDTVSYMGEALGKSDPTDPDTSGEGIPDGWQAYYQREGSPGPSDDARGLVTRYAAGEPAWWNVTRHGVWWWGLPPQAPPCGDLDGDGLNDDNGEDPFPASGDNRYTYGSFQTQDPQEAKRFILQAGGETERKRAQAWGPSAGNPLPVREHLQDGCPENTRPSMTLTDLTLAPDPPAIGTPFNVTGQVLGPDGAPAARETVLVSTLRPSDDRVLGVDFTGPEGRFRIETTFTKDHTTFVPEDALFLGATGTEVSWSSEVAGLSPGPRSEGEPNRLVVWTYNTTDASWAHQPIDRAFEAVTRLTVDTDPTAPEGRPLPVNATLEDALGNPLPDRELTVAWDGTEPATERTATTDTQGAIQLTLPEPDGIGSTELRVRFPGSQYLREAERATTVTVLSPSNLTIDVDGHPTRAGGNVTVTGRLTSQDAPVPAATITVTAKGSQANATTNPDGTFHTRLRVPSSVSAGALPVLASFEGTEHVAAAQAQTEIQVLGLARVQAPAQVMIPQATGGLIEGRLVDGRDSGIPGHVNLQADGLPGAQAAAGSDGRWRMALPAGLPRGAYAASLQVPATDAHAAATHPLELVVRSQAGFALAGVPDVVHPGGRLDVAGQLEGADGVPVPDAGVTIRFGTETVQVLTGEQGRFQATLSIPEDAPLGARALHASYGGTVDRSLTNASATRTVHVKQATDLSLSTRHTPLAHPSLAGRLTGPEGDGRAGEPVHVTLRDPDTGALVDETVTPTSASGSFNATLLAPHLDQAQAANVTLVYPGSARLASTTVHGTVNLTTPLTWNASLPDELAHGEPVPVEGTVFDAAGARIGSGTVVARLDGHTVGQAPVRQGSFEMTIIAPPSVPPGPHELTVTLEPRGLHARTPLAGTVQVTTEASIDVQMTSEATQGEPYQATVELADQAGRPIPNATLVYWLASDGDTAPPATARTNATGAAQLAGTVPDTLGSGQDAKLVVQAKDPRLSSNAAVATQTEVGGIPSNPIVEAGLAAAALILFAAAAYLVHQRRRQVSEVEEIVEDLIRDLEAGNEYEVSVLHAYQRLTRHLETHGFLDQPEYSAREYLDAVQQALPLPRNQVEAFVSLFEEVRYSPRTAGPTERSEATRLLRELRTSIHQMHGRAAA